MSFDVAGHKHVPLEIYGTEGTLIVPDPNHFGGEVELLKKGGQFEPQPFSSPMRMAITDPSALQTWPTPFAKTVRIGPMVISRCMYWR